MKNLIGVELACHNNGKAAPSIFVDHRQHAECPAILRAILDEIVRPDMALAFGPQPDAGAAVQPKPAALWLLLRNFEPFPPPDAVHPFQVDPPAFTAKQRRNPPVAVTAVGCGKPDDRGCQCILIIGDRWPAALCCARLPKHSARPAFGHLNLRANEIHAVAAAGRA
jgi:hypothetical protein